MKISTKTIIVLVVIVAIAASAAIGLLRSLSDVPQISRFNATMGNLDKRGKRYLYGQEEIITFYARECAGSDKMIARKAILIRRPNAKVTVFVFHGFMCSKQDIRFLTNALFTEPLNGEPVNTITIDFRAHGDLIEGQCCSLGGNEMYDVEGIVDYVRNHSELKDTRRFAYGFSMGAVASILAQADDPTLFEAAVWDCPFESSDNVLGRAIERLKFSVFGYEVAIPFRSLLHKYAYHPYIQEMLKMALKTIAKMDTRQVETCIVPVNTLAAISEISIPVMLIAGKNDEKAPVTAVKSLFDALKGYKRLWITNGRCHFDSYFFNPEKYIYKVRRHFEKVLDGTINERYQDYVSEDLTER